MGKAMAVQSARVGRSGILGAAGVAGLSSFSSQATAGKAQLHTSDAQEACAVEGPSFAQRDKGKF
jgi:5-aminolevulinate synthase